MRYLLVALLVGVVCAQAKPDPLRYVPPAADAVIQLAGPAKWRQDFAQTNVGKALADPELEPIWEKLLSEVLAGQLLSGLADSEERQRVMRELWKVVEGYSGQAVLSARSDWDASVESDRWRGAACIVLGGDGSTDLGALVDLVVDALPGERAGEVELGGVPAVLRVDEGTEWLGPVLHEGHFVLLVGQELERRAAWFFEENVERARWEQPPGQALSAVLRVKPMIAALVKSGSFRERIPEWAVDELGLLAGKECGYSVRVDGEYVAQDTWATMDENGRGLLGVFYPPRASRPTLLRYLPAGAGNYTASPFDVDELLRIYEHVFATHAEHLPIERAELDDMVRRATKLDLLKDVFAHVDGEYLRIENLTALDEEDEEDSAAEQVGDACFVVKLRNGRALAKSVDTAIRARGLHVGRKRQDYNGTNIYRMTLLGSFPLEYAVTDSLLVVGLGASEGTRRHLRGVLDAYAAVAAGADPLPLAPVVQDRVDRMPDGWGGMDAISLLELIETVLSLGKNMEIMLADEGMAVADIDGPTALLFQAASTLQGVVKRHRISMAVNLFYFEKDRYLIRSRW